MRGGAPRRGALSDRVDAPAVLRLDADVPGRVHPAGPLLHAPLGAVTPAMATPAVPATRLDLAKLLRAHWPELLAGIAGLRAADVPRDGRPRLRVVVDAADIPPELRAEVDGVLVRVPLERAP